MRWIMIGLASLLAIGLALVIFLMAVTVTPDLFGIISAPSITPETSVEASVTPNVAAILESPTPSLPHNGNDASSSGAITGTLVAVPVTVTGTVAVSVATTEPPISITLTPTDAIDLVRIEATVPTEQRVSVQRTDDINVAATWGDVLHYHGIGDWRQARQSLMGMLSASDGVPDLALDNQDPVEQARRIHDQLLSKEEDFYWVKWGDAFQSEDVRAILADIYVGLAMEPDSHNVLPGTIEYLRAVSTLLPDNSIARRLSATTTRFIDAAVEEQDLWMDEMVQAHLDYVADRLADKDNGDFACVIADTLTALNARVSGTAPEEEIAQYRAECADIKLLTESTDRPRTILRATSGAIYYSTEIDNRYVIMRVGLNADSTFNTPTVVVEDGAQPSLNGNWLAFYSRRNDSQGLSGVDLTSAYAPDQRFSRYTGAVEDAREGPARWHPFTDQFVFSSKDDGDGKPRIYTAATIFAGDNRTKNMLDLGEDPIWSPDGSQIVFRDIGTTGNTPGLFSMTATGQERTALTSGDDRRPVWTPDGKQIIFMRRVSGTNWELFRRDTLTGEVVRLTRNDAQDGLPALSPDGQTILFATDRSGSWELWTMAVAGGEAEFFMPIQGTLLQWLEHAIQWVN